MAGGRPKAALILTDDERVHLDSLAHRSRTRRTSRVVHGLSSRAQTASTTGWWPSGCGCRRSPSANGVAGSFARAWTGCMTSPGPVPRAGSVTRKWSR